MQCPGVAVCLQAILSESWIYKTYCNMREFTIMCVCVMCRSFKTIRLSSVLG
jgi:hypothetical protein